MDEQKRKEEHDTVSQPTNQPAHTPPSALHHTAVDGADIHSMLSPPPLSYTLVQSSAPPGFSSSAAALAPPPATATVSVPLPSDVYGSAPSLYIPLPARHFSSMSKSELALVIKLQLSQLQNQSSDSHHNDTFYSSVMEMRTKGRVSKSLQQLPPILHNRQQQQQQNTATAVVAEQAVSSAGSPPLHFKPTDSTLGRLQSSSLKKPKKLMELASGEQLPSDGAGDGTLAYLHTTDTHSHGYCGELTPLSGRTCLGRSLTSVSRFVVVCVLLCHQWAAVQRVANCSAALEQSLTSSRRVAHNSTQRQSATSRRTEAAETVGARSLAVLPLIHPCRRRSAVCVCVSPCLRLSGSDRVRGGRC